MTQSLQWWSTIAKSPEDGLVVLKEAAASGAWRADPTGWFDALVVASRPSIVSQASLQWLIDAVVGSELDSAAEKVLAPLFEACASIRAHDILGRIAQWLAPQVTPATAAVVLELLDAIHRCRPGADDDRDIFPEPVMPLVRALVDVGPAELRMRLHRTGWDPRADSARDRVNTRAEDLYWLLARSFQTHGSSQHLNAAVRYLVQADFGAASFRESIKQNVWTLAEQALEGGLPHAAATDVVGMLARAGWVGVQSVWRPLLVDAHPSCAAAIGRAVLRGEFDDYNQARGLEALLLSMRGLPPELDERIAARVLDVASNMTAFPHNAVQQWGVEPSLDTAAAWAGLAGRSLARCYTSTSDARVRLSIERALAWPRHELVPALVIGVRKGANVALDLVDDALPQNPAHLRALVAAMQRSVPIDQQTGDPDVDSLDALRRYLLRLAAKDLEPACGVDLGRLLEGVVGVEFGPLPDERKVVVSGGVLRVDPCELPRAPADSLWPQAGVVYVVHELVHIAQGFDDKASVVAARAIGAENAIAYIDLEADHITTLLLARAYPEWSLLALKDRTGRGMAGYPVGAAHTAAARHRKATRLVSSRFDLALRRVSGFSAGELGDGFAFLDYAPTGGHCLAFLSGPPLKLLAGPLPLVGADREALLRAADDLVEETDTLAEVDRVVANLAEALVDRTA